MEPGLLLDTKVGCHFSSLHHKREHVFHSGFSTIRDGPAFFKCQPLEDIYQSKIFTMKKWDLPFVKSRLWGVRLFSGIDDWMAGVCRNTFRWPWGGSETRRHTTRVILVEDKNMLPSIDLF